MEEHGREPRKDPIFTLPKSLPDCVKCRHTAMEHVWDAVNEEIACVGSDCYCISKNQSELYTKKNEVPFKNLRLVCCPNLDNDYYNDRFGPNNWGYCVICDGVHHHKYHAQELAASDDPVNHPSHYNMYHGLEIIDLTEQMNFNKGNAVKYIARAGFKGGPKKEVEDLEKAQWYISRELERIKQNPDDIP